MEIPKDYSNVYNEEIAPVPASRPSQLSSKARFDGEFAWRRRKETGGGIDLNELLPKLHTLSKEQHKSYANSTLRQHYNDVFQKRTKPSYKVGIEYMEAGQLGDRYLVKVDRNTLEDVKAKLPIKGNYRLFFTHHPSKECEEIEDDQSSLPVHKRDNDYYIHCRVFKK